MTSRDELGVSIFSKCAFLHSSSWWCFLVHIRRQLPLRVSIMHCSSSFQLQTEDRIWGHQDHQEACNPQAQLVCYYKNTLVTIEGRDVAVVLEALDDLDAVDDVVHYIISAISSTLHNFWGATSSIVWKVRSFLIGQWKRIDVHS